MILTLGHESLKESMEISHVACLPCECQIKSYVIQSLYSKYTRSLFLSEPAPYPRPFLKNSKTIDREKPFIRNLIVMYCCMIH